MTGSSLTGSLLGRHGWVLAILVSLPALAPVLSPGWYEGHDDQHIFRLFEYDLALRDGQIPPRWFPDISAGYGSPHPSYYAPLFYVIAETFHLGGLSVIASLKAAIALLVLLSSVSMFFLARAFYGSPAALVAAAAYTYAPYHLLDLYVRKAFSEFSVFAFLPALLLCYYNLFVRGSRWDVIAAALSTAAMCMAHTISTMMVPPLLIAYALLLTLRSTGTERWLWLRKAAVAAIIGASISGFFTIPAVLERNDVNIQIYTSAYVDYAKHFVYPIQMIWWPWGYGLSLEGLRDQISFRIGLLQIAGALLAVSALGRPARIGKAGSDHAIFFLVLTGVALFMMMPVSNVVWTALPALHFVQFPWRFLMIASFGTAALCGIGFLALGHAPDPRSPSAASRGWVLACVLAAAFPVASALGGMLSVHLSIPTERIGFTESPYIKLVDRGEAAAGDPWKLDSSFVRAHTLSWFDHVPAGAPIRVSADELRRPRIEVAGGSGRFSDLRAGSREIRFRVDAATTTRIRVNTYRHPGWTVLVDGSPVPLVEIPGTLPVILFDVGEGSHQVLVQLSRTSPGAIGDLTTLVGLAAIALIGLWPVRE